MTKKVMERLRAMSDEELDRHEAELRAEFMTPIELRRDDPNFGKWRQIKKMIARVLTVKRERKKTE